MILYRKNLALKQSLSEQESINAGLVEKVAQLEQQVTKLSQSEQKSKAILDTTTSTMQEQIEQLQTSLNHANTIIEKLSNFKTSDKENASEGVLN